MERDNRSYTDVFVLTMLSWDHRLSTANVSRRADSTEGTKCPNKTQEPSKVIQLDICVLGEAVKFRYTVAPKVKVATLFTSCLRCQRTATSALPSNQELTVSNIIELTWLHGW